MAALLVIALKMIFRRVRWVVLPMLCCGASTITMLGLLGLTSMEVTVVSSNFLSLQLIFTMALAIHLTVRYRELARSNPQSSRHKLVRDTVRLTFTPCLYAALTTSAGFLSLITCEVLPVVNFGFMMTMGIAVSLAVTFLLFPVLLLVLPNGRDGIYREFAQSVTAFFAGLADRRGLTIEAATAAVALITATGISFLEVENSFVNYFRESSEIHQGMKFIDRELGGTTPLDIIVRFDGDQSIEQMSATGDDEFSAFAEFEEASENPEAYWYTPEKLDLIERVHDYLDALPETGKVLSLATIYKTATQINGGERLDALLSPLLFQSLSDRDREFLVSPFVSITENEVRITTRIRGLGRAPAAR